MKKHWDYYAYAFIKALFLIVLSCAAAINTLNSKEVAFVATNVEIVEVPTLPGALDLIGIKKSDQLLALNKRFWLSLRQFLCRTIYYRQGLFNDEYKAQAQVLEIVYGSYLGNKINFTVFSHHREPKFPHFEHVLLFVEKNGDPMSILNISTYLCSSL